MGGKLKLGRSLSRFAVLQVEIANEQLRSKFCSYQRVHSSAIKHTSWPPRRSLYGLLLKVAKCVFGSE